MAADKIVITYSDTVAETDIRAQTLKTDFGDCLGSESDFKPITAPRCSSRAPN